MVDFSGNLLVLGCGGVAQCALPLILKLIRIKPSNITVMDFVDHRARIKESLEKGVHYVQQKLTQDNFQVVLETYLKKGDLFLDLSWNVETASMLDWCHHRGVIFLNTSVEEWDPYANADKKHPTELTLYHRQMTLRRMVAGWKNKKGPTAIVDHGANPGLVSHFVKQGLLDICTKIIRESIPSRRRDELEHFLEQEDFPRLAQLSGLKTIHISERDTQVTKVPKRPNEFVNTWSIEGLIEEGIAPAEMGWGTHEFNLPQGAIFHESGPCNQICLSQKGVKTWVRSWVPSGGITGMVIRHGEAFSLSDYLTVRDGETLIYRPTVHYAYCPCDGAINSLHEMEMRGFIPQKEMRLLADDIIEGKDELGCLLMGHDYQSWWIGSVLDIHEARQLVPQQNATTVQVAIGVVSALIHAIRHPNEGFCLPEDLNFKEILAVARPYLGNMISESVDWNPLVNASAYANYEEEVPGSNEMWQFTTFQVGLRPSCREGHTIHTSS